jgi:hypothetical protein
MKRELQIVLSSVASEHLLPFQSIPAVALLPRRHFEETDLFFCSEDYPSVLHLLLHNS